MAFKERFVLMRPQEVEYGDFVRVQPGSTAFYVGEHRVERSEHGSWWVVMKWTPVVDKTKIAPPRVEEWITLPDFVEVSVRFWEPD